MNYFTKALNLLLVVGMFATVYVMGSIHTAAELWPDLGGAQHQQTMQERAELPVNVPAWKASDKSFGCTEMQTEEIHDNVLVVTQANERVVMSFDDSWHRTHNDTKADDLWVVGFC